jgi:predicted dehydrogenase
VAAIEVEGGAQVSLTSVWHQLLDRPSLRRLEVICEHAFFTLEHDVLGPVTWVRPGEAGALEGQELFDVVAERHGGRNPNQDLGFVEAVASGEQGDHPDFAVALRAHQVVDGIYRSAGRGGDAEAVMPTGGSPSG